jgi:DNA-directed RNA polymerase sigma subunit (sigma70/sigma32)
LDVEAELAAQERLEAAASSQQPEVETQTGRRLVQDPGWRGSSSLLAINWAEGALAEQEALRRLGYARLSISEETRAFVLHAARAYQLTLRQERDLTAQLTAARLRLAELQAQECDSQECSTAAATIAELECALVYSFQWVAVKKAPAFLGQGVELDDLIQTGMEGVMAGIRHFDSTRGTRLVVTVNWWVFQALSRAVWEDRHLVRLPAYLHEALARVKKHQDILEARLGRLPTQQELAEAVQLSCYDLAELQHAEKTILPLSRYIRAEHAHEGYSFQLVEERAFIQDEAALIDASY